MSRASTSASATTAKARAPALNARVLQRQCAYAGRTGPGGECADCGKQSLQRKARQSRPAAARAPEIVQAALRSPGQPLDSATRRASGELLAHDFGRVRIQRLPEHIQRLEAFRL